jgi:hypothetical protein
MLDAVFGSVLGYIQAIKLPTERDIKMNDAKKAKLDARALVADGFMVIMMIKSGYEQLGCLAEAAQMQRRADAAWAMGAA